MASTPLAGTTALVTGASSGIGAATARQLAADGAAVAVLARREDRLESLADDIAAEHGVATHVVPADVSDPAQVTAAIESTVDTLGSLDGVVVNAGVGRGSDVESLSNEQYRTMMDVNVDGAFYTARESLPYLRDGAGSLVFVGSFAGQYPRPFNPVYAATKWWLRGFAHSLAGQVGSDDVGITVVNPSEVRSEFGSAEGTPFNERFEPGEVTEPDEVAAAISFAMQQEPPTTINSIDVFRRDKFEHF